MLDGMVSILPTSPLPTTARAGAAMMLTRSITVKEGEQCVSRIMHLLTFINKQADICWFDCIRGGPCKLV